MARNQLDLMANLTAAYEESHVPHTTPLGVSSAKTNTSPAVLSDSTDSGTATGGLPMAATQVGRQDGRSKPEKAKPMQIAPVKIDPEKATEKKDTAKELITATAKKRSSVLRAAEEDPKSTEGRANNPEVPTATVPSTSAPIESSPAVGGNEDVVMTDAQAVDTGASQDNDISSDTALLSAGDDTDLLLGVLLEEMSQSAKIVGKHINGDAPFLRHLVDQLKINVEALEADSSALDEYGQVSKE